jgi:transposase
MSTLRYVGLDVHKNSVVMAVADGDSSPAKQIVKLAWSEPDVLKALRKLGSLETLKVCYEAGPTGYGLQRFLAKAKVDCIVVAPALVPRKLGEHIKTDRRDAQKLAHFLRSGDLTAVWVPDEQTEAIRDLERARDDARLAERRVKQQLLKFLLRQGRRAPEEVNSWTKAHWTWIRQQKFEHEAQQRVLADAIKSIEEATARLSRLDADIAESIHGWVLEPLVKNLQAFRGIQLVTAVALAAEIGDFSRFPRATKLMSFVGLVPKENSSGESRRLGGITKAGNRHIRRLLIEASWHYVGAPLVISQKLADRRKGVPAEVVSIADRALRRLRKKSHVMTLRKKSSTKIATALARELVGFVWAAAKATPRLLQQPTITNDTKAKPAIPQKEKAKRSSRVTVKQ